METGKRAMFGRREFLFGAGAIWMGLGTGASRSLGARMNASCCEGENPVACIRNHQWDVLVAFVEAQLASLWNGPPADDPAAVAEDVIRYVEHLDHKFQRGFRLALTVINLYSVRYTFRQFSRLDVEERTRLLNQGEYRSGSMASCSRPLGRVRRSLPLITWDCRYLIHTAISSIAMITRLVTNSRPPARRLVNLTWSAPCRRPENLAHLEPPGYPDLNLEYDICVIGSGAGGSVVAAMAAERGKRVLIIEEGDWVSPDALVVRHQDQHGQAYLSPPRDDEVLMRVYREAGVQIAGALAGLDQSGGGLLSRLSEVRQIRPQQTINILQAKVVGGGPYINNAIHLPIPQTAWEAWAERRPAGLTYDELKKRMHQINRDLGVNEVAPVRCAGARSLKFVEGCQASGENARPVPVSILPDCLGCGADNSIDPFGKHIGGLHPYLPQGPNSYLMRALHADPPARIAYGLRAVRLEISSDAAGCRAARLIVEDRRGRCAGVCGPTLSIRARQFVLAAGPIASTVILANTLHACGLRASGLGERLTANVVMPVYAFFPEPLPRLGEGIPEPGIAQCFYVDRRQEIVDGRLMTTEPAIENWFHFPGGAAVALSGWFQHYGRLMRQYNQMAIAGMVVPTEVRPGNRIDPDGTVHLEVDDREFQLVLEGIRRIAKIYFAAGGVSLGIPTKSVLLRAAGCPLEIRNLDELEIALAEIRRRGPAFLDLATAHPQGGNALGSVVHPSTFRVQLSDARQIENLYVADASIFPAGCEVNPQLTVKALAACAAESVLAG